MSPYYSDHNSRLHHSSESSYKEHFDDNNHYHNYHHHDTDEDDDGLLYLEDPPALLLGPNEQAFCPTQDFLTTSMTTPPSPMQHYLTIEELRLARNSCWLCGCNWQQDHVSLDCPECGGYALSRPCPNCDGKCAQLWKRNINITHDSHKASWTGHCSMVHGSGPTSNNNSGNTKTRTQSQLSQAARTPDNNNVSNNRRDKTATTTLVFDQHHTNDANSLYDHAAKTFPSLGQRALTKNLCPV